MNNTTLLAPEVQKTLHEYNNKIEHALLAVQRIESVVISSRLAKRFWVKESQIAPVLQKDYLLPV